MFSAIIGLGPKPLSTKNQWWGNSFINFGPWTISLQPVFFATALLFGS